MLISHGISITPILSILKSFNKEYNGKIYLYYGITSADDFFFENDLISLDQNLEIHLC